MTVEPLATLALAELPDGRMLVTVRGEIDISNSAELESQLNDACQHGEALAVDLSGVDYMDSQGVRILTRLSRRHVQGGIDLELIARPGSVAAELIDIVGLAAVVPVVAELSVGERDAGARSDQPTS